MLEDSLGDLERAVDALTAKWRGEDVPRPVPPKALPETVENDEVQCFASMPSC